MNKYFKFSIALASLSLALAACTKPTPKPTPEPGPGPDTGAWSDAAKAKMNEVLGHELPYYDIGEYSFDYDEDFEVWEIYNTTSTSRVADAKAYNALLSTMNGYTLLEADEEDETEGVLYSYYKVISETEDSTTYNYVDVQTWKDRDADYNFLGTYTLWIDFNRITESKEDPVDPTEDPITSWTDEQKASMQASLGLVLPLPEAGLPAGTKVTASEDSFEISLEGTVAELTPYANFYATYLASEEAGFSGSFGEDDYGYSGDFRKATGNQIERAGYSFDEVYAAQLSVLDYDEYIEYGYSSEFSLSASISANPITTDKWPAEAIKAVLGEETTAPLAFGAESYQFIIDALEENIQVLVEVGSVTLESYIEELTANAYYVEDYRGTDYEYYFGISFWALPWKEDFSLEIGDYETAVVFSFELYEDGGDLYEEFPAAALAKILGLENAEVLPGLPSAVVSSEHGYKVWSSEDEDTGTVYACLDAIDNKSGEKSLAESYADALEGLGYTIVAQTEDGITTYAATLSNDEVKLTIEFSQTGSYFSAYFSASKPVVLGNSIDFSTEDNLITKNGEKSVWEFAHGTMTVEKGTSATDVGNTDKFAKPLRLYKGQKVTFKFDEGYVPTQIVIECNTTADKSKLANLTENSAITGAEITNVDGNTVTLTLSADEVSITIGGGQIHFDSVSFVYAA